MKAKLISYFIIGLYPLLLIGIYISTNIYVDNKRDVLRKDAYENLEEFFSKQKMFVNVGYSGEKVAYEQTPIPKYQSYGGAFENQHKQEWQDRYGEIFKMYKLKPKYTSENEWDSDCRWTGWLLYIIEEDGYGQFQEYQLYPYQVGFKKQSDPWMYDYMPTIQTAINEAFDFHTTNSKSSYSRYMTREDNKVSCYDIIHEVENEYYVLFSYDDLVERKGKDYADSIMIWSPWDKGDQNFISISKAENQISSDGGGMHNGYYYVYNKYVPIKFWQMTYDVWHDPQTKDRNVILAYSIPITTIIFILILIPLIVKAKREKQIQNETLRDTLLRVCSPNNYMKPFIKEKVEIANNLYAKVNQAQVYDEEQLKSIRREAESNLGINFICNEEKQKLIKTCNPTVYMKPYDEAKVKLATELYSLLTSSNLNIDEFELIKERSKGLT